MTGVHVYDPSRRIEYRHPGSAEPTVSDNGLATWQGHRDPLTGERVLTAWAFPKPPKR